MHEHHKGSLLPAERQGQGGYHAAKMGSNDSGYSLYHRAGVYMDNQKKTLRNPHP